MMTSYDGTQETVTPINFIPCNEITDDKFTSGYFDDILENALDPLCPENGNIDYSGMYGTALWVFPRQGVDTEYDPPQFSAEYQTYNTYAQVQMVYENFDVNEYQNETARV
jgi:hypothetical protein